jgi:transposase-like protein
MIRLFSALCKATLEHLSDDAIFNDSTASFRHYAERCPACGSVGKLSTYGDYSRGLVSVENRKVVDSRIQPLRFTCSSCNITHALLSGNLIPYSPYSLRFMLTVLIAYFERTTSIVALCAHFGIAVSTLYAWKHRLLEHKELLLGALASQRESALNFLRGLLASDRIAAQLGDFFGRFGFSFMQNRPQSTTRCHPP